MRIKYSKILWNFQFYPDGLHGEIPYNLTFVIVYSETAIVMSIIFGPSKIL